MEHHGESAKANRIDIVVTKTTDVQSRMSEWLLQELNNRQFPGDQWKKPYVTSSALER